jgi:hypothetical protein
MQVMQPSNNSSSLTRISSLKRYDPTDKCRLSTAQFSFLDEVAINTMRSRFGRVQREK